MHQLLLELLKLFSIICIIPLICTTVISLIISFLQAVTQIQEQSLLFLVKLFSIIGIIFFTGTYVAELVNTFTASVFTMIAAS